MEELESVLQQWSELTSTRLNSLGMEEDVLVKLTKADSAILTEFNDTEAKLKGLLQSLKANQEGNNTLTSEVGQMRTALSELQSYHARVESYRSKAEADLKATEETVARLRVTEEERSSESLAFEAECKMFEDLCKMRVLKVSETDLQFVFTYVDESDPDLPFIFTIRPETDGMYSVFDMDPLLPDLEDLTAELNSSKDFGRFVRVIRHRWTINCSKQM